MRMSSGPSYLIHPFFSRPGSIETNTWLQEALVPRASAKQEACRAHNERLWLQKLKRWGEGNLELICSRAACEEKCRQ
jgi:hypothetical protein